LYLLTSMKISKV